MKPSTSKKLLGIGALVVAGGLLTALAFSNIEENLVYFWTPEDLLQKGKAAHGATVRLGGMVLEGTVDWNADTLALEFIAGMEPGAPGPDNPSVTVKAKGAPPQMFREGIGVVVEGSYDGKVFNADRVMVKHSNEYHPPEEGEKPEEVYRTLLTD